MRSLTFLTVTALAVFSALNWRAQVRSQHQLEAMTAALAARPTAPPAATGFPMPPGAPYVYVPVPRGLVLGMGARGTGPAAPSSDSPVAQVVPAAAHQPVATSEDALAVKVTPYVIEAPDQLMIEVVVRDPKTGTTDRLPKQPISGAFLVRPDGTVGLGMWGSVPVAGLTRERAAQKIREHVANAHTPELNPEKLLALVNVLAANSKRYYVISSTGPNGEEQVVSFPVTGSETVMDVVGNIGGLSGMAKKSLRVVRKQVDGKPALVLPVDLAAFSRGEGMTNYQILPGDRLYVTDIGGPVSLEFADPAVPGSNDKKHLFNFSVGVFGGKE
jgi:polysaccharide export outer membrane protein